MDSSVSLSQQTFSEISPCIVELFRTGHCPPILRLRVERVIEVPIAFLPVIPGSQVAKESRNTCDENIHDNGEQDESKPDNETSSLSGITASHKTYRIFLSDGEYTIQALLKKHLHYFASSTDEISPGAVLELQSYTLRTANRSSPSGLGHKAGKIAFLAVERFRRVDITKSDKQAAGSEVSSDMKYGKAEKGKLVIKRVQTQAEKGTLEDGSLCRRLHKRQRTISTTSPNSPTLGILQKETKEEGEEKEEASFIDCIEYEEEIIAKRSSIGTNTTTQEAKGDIVPTNTIMSYDNGFEMSLANDNNSDHSYKTTSSDTPPATVASTQYATQAGLNNVSIKRPSDLLTLSDLLHPQFTFPKRNHICDVIAVISWISPQVIKRTYMPPKRDLRLIDPTIISTIDKRRSNVVPSTLPSSTQPSPTANGAMGISMSVFVDAANFHPQVGTVALFRGLKTHEWDGISLNAYEKDCRGKQWFITEPGHLAMLGVDAFAMKKWWLETQARWEGARHALSPDARE